MKNILALGLFIFLTGFLNAQIKIGDKMESFISDIMSKLTLEEKASLCSGQDIWSSQPIERLNIPSIWMADGPHGVRKAPQSYLPGFGDQHPATCFPTASALAASWDLDLIYQVGQTLGDECQALGVHILLGPGVNIKRSVLGGRNFEYFSEDPILSGELGAAFINGVQSKGVGTSLKHFVANNVETNRMYANSNLDNRTLHEIYLTPFEIAVKQAQPWTVMACYNRVQGEYGTQHPYLLTEILKEKWGFEGVVISDWVSVVDRVAGIGSGMHIEMPKVTEVNDKLIVKAVQDGTLEESALDKLIKENLEIVLKAKSLEKERGEFDKDKHHGFARQVASETITLLKNENDVLPVSINKYKKIAVIGEFATAPRFQGNGSSEVKPTQLDAALDIIKMEYGEDFEISYAQGYRLSDDEDYSFVDEAKKLAASSDIALIFAGLPLHYEAEGYDRKHINLPPSHNRLISEVASVQNNSVVVLTNGSAIAMPWVSEVSGILESWLGGQAGAGGTADVLFGKVNPSGKLAETFPVKLKDTPSYFNFPGEEGEVEYGERIFVGYRYYEIKDIEPLFPFGFGLSYTTFEYGNLKVSADETTDQQGLTATITIKNTGPVTGKEIVQLYVGDKESLLIRPKKELKKFAKIELVPGEEKQVTFELDNRDFSYYDSRRDMWIAESGEFTIAAGSSSRDIRSSKTVMLTSTQKVPLAYDEYTFFSEYWKNPQTRKFLIELVPNWIKIFTPEGKSAEEAIFPEFYVDHPIIKFPNLTGGEITHEKIQWLVEQCERLTYTP